MNSLLKHGKLSTGLLLSLTFLLIYLTDRYVLTAAFYEANGNPFFSVSGSSTHIYEALQKWVYLSAACYLLLKVCTIAMIIHAALYLQDKDVSYSSIFNVVVAAELIFIIPAALKLILFNYTVPNGNLLDWHRFSILSVLSMVGDAPANWYYALKTLNVFEVGYWFLLAYGVSRATDHSYDGALRIVVCSYVPALLVWIASSTFISLMMFPATG